MKKYNVFIQGTLDREQKALFYELFLFSLNNTSAGGGVFTITKADLLSEAGIRNAKLIPVLNRLSKTPVRWENSVGPKNTHSTRLLEKAEVKKHYVSFAFPSALSKKLEREGDFFGLFLEELERSVQK